MSRRPRTVFATARARARPRPDRALALATLVVSLGCGLHLHRPHDAATAESADSELKASRLVDGFAEEFAQSRAMLAEELAAAQTWAEVERDRDLLDILGARGESDPEVAPLYFPRCQARFRGDGWTTLCSKISTRLHDLTGYALPFDGPPPTGSKGKQLTPLGPDRTADLLRDLRGLQRHWKGPHSGESQLARAVSEYELTARAHRLSGAAGPPARCPLFDPPGRSPVLTASIERQRALCKARRDNLEAIERSVCHGESCGASALGAHAVALIAVHDALAAHHDELSRRLYAYEAAKRPCTRPDPAGGRARARTRPSGQANTSSQAGPSGHANLSVQTGPSGHLNATSGTGPSGQLNETSGSGPSSQLNATSGTGPSGQPVATSATAPSDQPPATSATGPSAQPPAVCDEAVLRHRFAALAEI
ncbi:MAG TPA: hypothetical protein VIK91_24505, partial [Nannocystis sp.]